MKLGDKVFVVTAVNVLEASVKFPITHKGAVTGYDVSFTAREDNTPTLQFTKISRKDIFTDETDAKKELFKRKLKKDEERVIPAEDKKGDRHWKAGYKKNRY